VVWSPINHIPHRQLAAATAFMVLSTGNGTALTLTGSHIVYVSDAASGPRKPASARDVKVCRWPATKFAAESTLRDLCGSLCLRPLRAAICWDKPLWIFDVLSSSAAGYRLRSPSPSGRRSGLEHAARRTDAGCHSHHRRAACLADRLHQRAHPRRSALRRQDLQSTAVHWLPPRQRYIHIYPDAICKLERLVL